MFKEIRSLRNYGLSCNSIFLNESIVIGSIVISSFVLWNLDFFKMFIDFNIIIEVLERCILGKSLKR